MRIPETTLFAALAVVLLNSCAERDPVTLPEIDTSAPASGIVVLPDDVPQVFQGLLREVHEVHCTKRQADSYPGPGTAGQMTRSSTAAMSCNIF